jgi:uncharacterized membrane protein YkgB
MMMVMVPIMEVMVIMVVVSVLVGPGACSGASQKWCGFSAGLCVLIHVMMTVSVVVVEVRIEMGHCW